MKSVRLVGLTAALIATLALVGCDNNDKTQAVASASAAQDLPSAPTAKPDAGQLKKLAQQTAGKPLKLLDASEAQLVAAANFTVQ
ncbi:hypothetical protein [Cedecea colo]|uniref:Uncharacterized protein n=1 Tax=Cedecea colo TaxID=2552946 RepID=A0ABX0VPK3_9ENTR|nr:hypothetical protein [Cedecea colo]NIY49009.1 hypothetical protein [Cedecea colo]